MKFLLKIDKISKIIFHKESLKKTLWIGRSKKNKLAVFEFSNNFMAQVKAPKIPQKIF